MTCARHHNEPEYDCGDERCPYCHPIAQTTRVRTMPEPLCPFCNGQLAHSSDTHYHCRSCGAYILKSEIQGFISGIEG